MEGSTSCVVFESDNCDKAAARKTFTEKNIISWPPIIPVAAWRQAFYASDQTDSAINKMESEEEMNGWQCWMFDA